MTSCATDKSKFSTFKISFLFSLDSHSTRMSEIVFAGGSTKEQGGDTVANVCASQKVFSIHY